jgi:hypothetical protein
LVAELVDGDPLLVRLCVRNVTEPLKFIAEEAVPVAADDDVDPSVDVDVTLWSGVAGSLTESLAGPADEAPDDAALVDDESDPESSDASAAATPQP